VNFTGLVVLTIRRNVFLGGGVVELQEKRLTKVKMCDKTDRKLLMTLQKKSV